MHLWLLLLLCINAAADKTFKFEIGLGMHNGCGDGFVNGNGKPLKFKGARLVRFDERKKAGKYAPILATLVMQGEPTHVLNQGSTFSADNSVKDDKQIKAIEGMTEANSQLYLYIDDPEEKSPLNFGANDNLYKRTSFREDDESYYYNTPVRFSHITVRVNGKEIIKKTRKTACKETTSDWLLRAGIYRLTKCGAPFGKDCDNYQWINSYYDPYDGLVQIN